MLVVLAIASATSVRPTEATDSQTVDCIGDCNADGLVTIDEIVTGIDMTLGGTDAARCPAFECNGAGLGVSIHCAVAAVDHALNGCGEEPASDNGACCVGSCSAAPSTCQVSSRDFCCFYSQVSAIPLAIWWCPADQLDPRTDRCTSCVEPCLSVPTPTPTSLAIPTSTAPPIDVHVPPFSLSSLQDACWSESGAGLLAGIRPEYQGILKPRPETPWPSLVPLTVRLTYRGGAITCYPPYVPPPGSTRAFKREQVGVVIEVQFSTANGAFAETVDTDLKGGSGGGTLSFSRRPDEIQGTYQPDLPGYDVVSVGASGSFRDEWTNGVVFLIGVPPNQRSVYAPIAYWQSDSGAPPN
jgi:hypothetical protein